MTIQNKLVEDFRAKIKGIFKESAAEVDKEDELDQRPDASGKPTMPPKPVGPPVDINEEDEVVPGAEVAPEVGAEVPPMEEENVTLSVSLLKSLLDWAHGEEETEEGGEEDASGLEDAATDLSIEPEAAPVTEEEEIAPEATEPLEGGEVSPEAGEEEMEDSGVESIEIQALVDKVKELAQTKEVLTDEDFGEIVAAAEAVEGGAEGEGLEGVLDGEGAGSELPIAPEAEPVTEDIGQIVPAGINNKGNKGIGK